MGVSRSYVVNRAFVANRWLNARYGISIHEADEAQLRGFLESLPADQREQTWEALAAYGDDLVRRGRASRNVARAVHVRA